MGVWVSDRSRNTGFQLKSVVLTQFNCIAIVIRGNCKGLVKTKRKIPPKPYDIEVWVARPLLYFNCHCNQL